MKWEYTTHNSFRLSGDQLNQLGNNGWELVSHFTTTSPERSVVYEYIFKRPKREIPYPAGQDPRLAAISKIINKAGYFDFSDLVGIIKIILVSEPEDAENLANDYCNRHVCIASPGWREAEEILSPAELARIRSKFAEATKRYEDLTPEELDAQTFKEVEDDPELHK